MFFYVILGDQFFEALVFIYRNRRIRNKETTSLPPEGSRRKGGTNVHRFDDRGSKRADRPDQRRKQAAGRTEKEGKKGTKKKPLDLGKVKALRDAGWSNSKIADELKVSTSTIQRAVTEMKGE